VLLGYLAQARDIAEEHGHVLVSWDVLPFKQVRNLDLLLP